MYKQIIAIVISISTTVLIPSPFISFRLPDSVILHQKLIDSNWGILDDLLCLSNALGSRTLTKPQILEILDKKGEYLNEFLKRYNAPQNEMTLTTFVYNKYIKYKLLEYMVSNSTRLDQNSTKMTESYTGNFF